MIFPRNLIWSFRPNFTGFLGYSILVSCSSNHAVLIEVLWGLLFFPWFPFEKGLRQSQRECFAIASNVQGSILPDLCSHSTLEKKFLRLCINFYLTGFLLQPYFLLFCRLVENQIEAIKNVFSIVLQIFDYQLTFLCSDFQSYIHIR